MACGVPGISNGKYIGTSVFAPACGKFQLPGLLLPRIALALSPFNGPLLAPNTARTSMPSSLSLEHLPLFTDCDRFFKDPIKMPPTLTSLPPELLDGIVECFEPVGPWSQEGVWYNQLSILRSLSLTCHVLNTVATPRLYRKFSSITSQAATRCLLMTLVKSPELAKHVQGLQIMPWGRDVDVSPDREDLKFYERALKSAKADSVLDKMVPSLTDGCAAAECALLLTLTPQLRKLRIDLYHCSTYGQSEQNTNPNLAACVNAWFASNVAQERYTRLSEITLVGETRAYLKRGVSIYVVADILRLPALRKLTLHGLGSYGDQHAPACASATSNVTTLILFDCYPFTGDTIWLIKACKSLKGLQLHWDPVQSDMQVPGEGPEWIDQAAIIDALNQHATSLETLAMTDLYNLGQTFAPRASVLTSLIALRELEVDDQVLLGANEPALSILHLPPHLNKLIVHVNLHMIDWIHFEQRTATLNDVLRVVGRDGPNTLEEVSITFYVEGAWNEQYRYTCRTWETRDRPWSFRVYQDGHGYSERIWFESALSTGLCQLLCDLADDIEVDEVTGTISLLSERADLAEPEE